MRQSGAVPASIDELVATHGNLIRYLILRVSRGCVRPDDIADLQQQVYLRIWEKQYLERCRVLLAERGGSFHTYLWWVVRSVCVNQFRKNLRNPVNTAKRALDPRDRAQHYLEGRPSYVADVERLRRDLMVDEGFEGRMSQKDSLERFAAFVARTRNGARLAKTLQQLYEGLESADIAERQRAPRSRIAHHQKQLRALRGVYLRQVG